jgi:hypothetical protein
MDAWLLTSILIRSTDDEGRMHDIHDLVVACMTTLKVVTTINTSTPTHPDNGFRVLLTRHEAEMKLPFWYSFPL